AAPTIALQISRNPEIGFRIRFCGNALDPAISFILRTERALSCNFCGRHGKRFEQCCPCGADRFGTTLPGPLHGDQCKHLQEMILSDVTKCAYAVIKSTAVLDAKRFEQSDI